MTNTNSDAVEAQLIREMDAMKKLWANANQEQRERLDRAMTELEQDLKTYRATGRLIKENNDR